jgi:hypothetical protein
MRPRPFRLLPSVTRTPMGWLYVRWMRRLWLVSTKGGV